MGIAAEFVPYLFERFTQADMGRTRQHGGLGLGLAITRHLIELHGGTITATSPGEGCGATFTVRLPVRVIQDDVDDLSPATSVDAMAMRAVLDGLHVLVVDDEAETRELLTTVLTGRGVDVTGCATAADALALLDAWHPDVLISDIGMPGEDGYALIAKVRRLSGAQRNVPAVALTAYARAEDRMRALAAGFQMHVPKPVEMSELLLVIARLAGRDLPPGLGS
jgi:CheY-like chemotaxis protein